MSKKVKIVVVGTVASSIFGFRMPFLKYLVEKDYQVYAFAMDYTEAQKNELRQMGMTPIDYQLSRASVNPYKNIKSVAELYKIIKLIKPDIFFGYFLKPVIFGSVVSKMSGVPKTVGMVEGLGYTFTDDVSATPFRKKIVRFVLKMLFRLSALFLDRVIVLNEDDKRDLSQFASFKSIQVLGGIGVDLNEYAYCEVTTDRACEFIFVARLLKEKGIEQFLDAAAKVKEKYPEVQFTVLGDFDEGNPSSLERSRMERLVDLGVVNHLGHVDCVADCLRGASVFVLPSYYREGVPRSTQEAMAIGRAIITTDSVGCKDTVINGYNGFLVPKWDVDELVKRMEYFVGSPECLVEMGENSRKLAEERFDIDSVNEKLWGFIYND